MELLSVIDAQLAEEWADRLLKRFGSLPVTLTATSEAQATALGEQGEVVALLGAVRDISLHAHRSTLEVGPLFPGNAAVAEYLHVSMGHLLVEQQRVLFLNAMNELIADEVVGVGTIDRSELHPREIIRRAIELGAVRLIFAHNHPSGDPRASQSDIRATRSLAEAASIMEMELLDHLIIGARGVISMRAAGQLQR